MLALTNGKIYTIANGVIDQGIVLVKDGKIAAVGTDVQIPATAQVIDVQGKVIMPGMIDPSTRLGIHEEGIGAIGNDADEATAPATPHLRPIDAINPEDLGFPDTLAAGVTTVAITPGIANVISGQISVLKTYGKTVDEMVVKEAAGLRVNISEATGRQRSDAAAIFLAELHKAKNYLATRKEDDDKLAYDLRLQAMVKVLQGELPVFMQGVRAHDILNAIELADEWGFELVIERCLEAHLVVEEIKESKRPVIVGSIMANRRGDTKPVSHRTPGILANAGITTALSTYHPYTAAEYALVQAAFAQAEGMQEADALASVTLNAAKTLGLDHQLGSIEPGKDADLVVMTGHPFSVYTKVTQVYIAGQLVHQAEGGAC